MGETLTIPGKTWKIRYTCVRPLHEDDGEQEANPCNGHGEKCIVQVEIMKVPEQDKHAVVFKRKAGSSFLFYERAGEMI